MLEPLRVGWKWLRFCTRKDLSERFETDGAASFVHSLWILHRVWPHVAVLIGLELCAVELRPAFEYADPVFQHGWLPSWDQLFPRGHAKELKARALELRVRDGMLGDQPGGFRGSFADEALRRPSDLNHDLPEPQRIVVVNGGHAWIITLVQFSRRRQLITDFPVVLRQGDEVVSNSAVHSEMMTRRAALEQLRHQLAATRPDR